MALGSLAGVIVGVLGYVALGVVLRLTGLMKSEDARPLNTLLIYVALPALIFVTVQPAKAEWSLAVLPALAWLVAFLGVGLAWAAGKVLKLPAPVAGALILAAAFGNTAFIGYPMASAIAGESGLLRAIFYDIFGNTAAVVLVGTIIASRFGEHDVEVSPIREVLTFPPFIALAAGLALMPVAVPDAVMDWLGVLGKLVVPLIMVSVGLSLKPAKLREHLPLALAVAGVKLLVLPFVAWTLGSTLLGDQASLRILVLEAGVPTMMLTLVIGTRFRLDADLIASAIVVTAVGSIVTIPALQLLI